MRLPSRGLAICALGALLAATPACGGAQSQSGDSSKGSGDSSKGSGDSSKGSGDSSKGSGDSSKGSADSSKGSGDSSRSDDSSKDSSRESTAGSSEESSKGTSGEDGTNLVLSTTLTGLTALGVAAVVLTARRDEVGAPVGAELERARRYLAAHRRALRIDLSRGDGPLVSDVAMTLRLPEARLPAVARALRAHREALLLPLSGADVTLDDTRAFGAALLAAVRADPELAPLVPAAPSAAL